MTNQDKVIRATQSVNTYYLRHLKDRNTADAITFHIMNAQGLKVNSTGSPCRESQKMYFP